MSSHSLLLQLLSLLLLRLKLPEGVTSVYSPPSVTSQFLSSPVCRLLVSRSLWPELTIVPISISLPMQQHQCSDHSQFSLAAPSHCLCRLLHLQCPSSRVSGLWAQPCVSATWSVLLPGTPLLGVAAVTSLAPCCHPHLSGVQCRYELKCKSRHDTSLFKAPNQFSVLSRPMRLT